MDMITILLVEQHLNSCSFSALQKGLFERSFNVTLLSLNFL